MPVVGRAAAIASTKKKPKRRRALRRKKKTGADPDENIGCFGSTRHNAVARKVGQLRDHKWFQTSIIGVIFVAGALVGIQTYPITDKATIQSLNTLDSIVLAVFIFELVVKFVAEGKRPHWFFKDSWNVFDFFIVVIGLMPFGGNAVTALRLVRLLRVLKLVRALPKLRILVMGLLKSMSSIAYIGLLLMLLFYLYAVLGVSVFGLNDPVHMGTLHIAFLTLFRCATLEDWTDVMYINMYGCSDYGYDSMMEHCTNSTPNSLVSIGYFCSFVILSSMMILNLFIGVITSSMQDAKSDLTDEAAAEDEEEDEQEVLDKRLVELGDIMSKITMEVDQFRTTEAEAQRRNSAVGAEAQRNSIVSAMGGSIAGVMPPTPSGGPAPSLLDALDRVKGSAGASDKKATGADDAAAAGASGGPSPSAVSAADGQANPQGAALHL